MKLAMSGMSMSSMTTTIRTSINGMMGFTMRLMGVPSMPEMMKSMEPTGGVMPPDMMTIMNIMENYALPKREFYEWHVGNGCGYLVELDSFLWGKDRRILQVIEKRDGEEIH